MTLAQYAGQDAVDGLKLMDERGKKLTKNSLKKLEGIMYPEYYVKVAIAMQKSQTTLRSLHT